MRNIASRKRCSICGESFATIPEYERHLERCSGNREVEKSKYIAQRLHEAAEELK